MVREWNWICPRVRSPYACTHAHYTSRCVHWCQHQRCPHYCLGQGTGATLTLGYAPYQYRLQRVQFVASRLTIFAAQPRTMDRSNGRLGEVVKRLFKGLLAVFRVRKLNTQWKRITIIPISARCLYSNEFSSTLTKQLLVSLQPVCVYVTAFSIVFYVLKCSNTMLLWVV